jgi:hypothetical protein
MFRVIAFCCHPNFLMSHFAISSSDIFFAVSVNNKPLVKENQESGWRTKILKHSQQIFIIHLVLPPDLPHNFVHTCPVVLGCPFTALPFIELFVNVFSLQLC